MEQHQSALHHQQRGFEMDMAHAHKRNDKLQARIGRLEKLLQLIILSTAHED